MAELPGNDEMTWFLFSMGEKPGRGECSLHDWLSNDPFSAPVLASSASLKDIDEGGFALCVDLVAALIIITHFPPLCFL